MKPFDFDAALLIIERDDIDEVLFLTRLALREIVEQLAGDERETLAAGANLWREVDAVDDVLDVLADGRAPIPTPVLAHILHRCLTNWDDGGSQRISRWSRVPGAEVQLERIILTLALRCAVALTSYPAGPGRTSLVDSLVRLATILNSKDPSRTHNLWAPCLLLARNPIDIRAAAEGMSRTSGESLGLPRASVYLTIAACNLVAITPDDAPAGRLLAFDTVWTALRHLPPVGEARSVCQHRLLGLIGQRGYLATLEPFIMFVCCPDSTAELSTEVQSLVRAHLVPEWQAGGPTIFEGLTNIRETVFWVEDARRLLVDRDLQGYEHADWESWSFTWSAYPVAVPIGRAIPQALDFLDHLLVLRHETTHVATMRGYLGLSLLALRSAFVDACLDLSMVSFRLDVQPTTCTIIPDLEGADVRLLAMAERALEISLKTVALQESWSPFLEGVAVYGELHANAATTEALTNIDLVILNFLADTVDTTGMNLEETFLAQDENANRWLGRAQSEVGALRLRQYLGAHGAKYLPGYLAVRALVSRWRETLGELSPTDAFRMLLHAATYISDEGVPDLGLSCDDFGREAPKAMLATLRSLARALPEDLKRVRDGAGTPSRWVRGRLVTESLASEEDQQAHYLTLLQTALKTLVGSSADAHRIDGASASCQAVARDIAYEMTKINLSGTAVKDLWKFHLRGSSVLPIATTTSPFWLDYDHSLLGIIIRTVDRGPGLPGGYQARFLRVGDFDDLVQQVRLHPEQRMRVMRAADMTATEGTGRGPGHQVLVFSLGTWVRVEHLGSRAGIEVAPSLLADVRLRLVQDYARLNGGDDSDRQTLVSTIEEWLDSVTEWQVGSTTDVAAWAAHMSEKTAQFNRDRGRDPSVLGEASRLLLDEVWPIDESLNGRTLRTLSEEWGTVPSVVCNLLLGTEPPNRGAGATFGAKADLTLPWSQSAAGLSIASWPLDERNGL